MQYTFNAKEGKGAEIPAVIHVDGTSRIQTVTQADGGIYWNLIDEFEKRTGVPMVLNTSFNTKKGEPIVESPLDAIRSFLEVENDEVGRNKVLVLGDFYVTRKSTHESLLDKEAVLAPLVGGVISRTVESGEEIGIKRVGKGLVEGGLRGALLRHIVRCFFCSFFFSSPRYPVYW